MAFQNTQIPGSVKDLGVGVRSREKKTDEAQTPENEGWEQLAFSAGDDTGR